MITMYNEQQHAIKSYLQIESKTLTCKLIVIVIEVNDNYTMPKLIRRTLSDEIFKITRGQIIKIQTDIPHTKAVLRSLLQFQNTGINAKNQSFLK